MIFKGSGFYHTDYKKTGSPEKSNAKPASGESKTETKKDSGPPPDSTKTPKKE